MSAGKLLPEDSLIYHSEVSRIPFQIETRGVNKKGHVITLHTAESLQTKEKKFNKLIDKLESSGWIDFIKIQPHVLNTESTMVFDFQLKTEFTPNRFQPEMKSFSLFTFDMVKGRVFLGLGIQDKTVEAFYFDKYNRLQAELTAAAYKQNPHRGISLEDALDFLEYIYILHSKRWSLLKPNYFLTKEMHIKLFAMSYIQRMIGYKYRNEYGNALRSLMDKSKYIDVILGDEELWLPYLEIGVTVENLTYLSTHTIQTTIAESKFKVIEEYEAAWNGKLDYTTDELVDGGSLPFQWFKQIYTSSYYKE